MSGDSKQPSRRGFFCESSVLLASTLPTRDANLESAAPGSLASSRSKQLSVGVVGCNRRSGKLVELALRSRQSQLSCVYDPRRSQLQQFIRAIKGRRSGYDLTAEQILGGESKGNEIGLGPLRAFLRHQHDLVILAPDMPLLVWQMILPKLVERGTSIYLEQPISTQLTEMQSLLDDAHRHRGVICIGTPSSIDHRYLRCLEQFESAKPGVANRYQVSVRLPYSNAAKKSVLHRSELGPEEGVIPWQQDWLAEVASATRFAATAFRSNVIAVRSKSHVEYGSDAFESRINLNFEGGGDAEIVLRRPDRPAPYQRRATLHFPDGFGELDRGRLIDLNGREVVRVRSEESAKFPEFATLLRVLTEPNAAEQAPLDWDAHFKLALEAASTAHVALSKSLFGS